MKFSIIIGTLNRKDSLMSCLNSFFDQACDDYEIIIVDQSDNDETKEAISQLDNQKIKYFHVDYKGLSRARNEALRHASGEYFCLVDDDAFYSENYLSIALDNLQSKIILSGRLFDTLKKGDFVKYKKKNDKKYISIRDVIRTCPSAALIIPMSVIHDVGGFDEKFGVGSVYGAGEETDLIIRAIKHGYRVKYLEGLTLKHPYPIRNQATIDDSKSGKYYEGIGALYRKHISFVRILPVMLEAISKLLIKRLIFRGMKLEKTKTEIRGFLYGFKNYK